MTSDLALYQSNRPKWLASAAPRLAACIATSTDAQIENNWPRAPRDYQTATWQHLDEVSRERVRRVRG